MKYCTHCGSEIMDEAVICVHCGCAVENSSVKKDEEMLEYANKAWTYALIGIFFAVFSIPALVYASKSKSKNNDKFCKKAKEAFITAIIELILWSFLLLLWF